MPSAPPTRCHCGRKATRRGRCDQHQPAAWANPSRNAQTLTRHDRHRFRREVLSREDTCRQCGSPDNLQADHIIPVAEGGATNDPNNGQALCRDCHTAKTQREAARGKARTRQAP